MARSFFTPINLNGLELQGAAIGNLSTSSINAITSGTGRIQYDSTLNVLKYRDNTGWQTISTGGGSFYLGSTSVSLGNISGSVTSITGLSITGNAATATAWATARNLAGNSVDGSANVAFSNKFIVQGTTDAGLSGAQFLGALGTGIVKNTTTTGVLSIAVAGDFPTLNQNTTGSAGSVANTLTFGTGLTAGGSSFNGSAATTITPVSATTLVAGIVQLSDSTSTTGSTKAATETAVKAAYDRGSTGVTNAATAQTTADNALPKAGGTMSGAIAMGSNKITGLGTPTLVDDAVTKAYVDTIATGINAHDAVSYASTSNISGTYSNGTSGVGATLTGTGSIVIDGYTVVSGDAGTNVLGGTGMRLLLKDQTSTDQNGIYAVTACVSGTSWTLTRAYDYDALGEVAAGDFTYVLLGTANTKFTFVETSKPAAISGVGTAGNAITFGVFANGNLSGIVTGVQGGTGVANSGKTITIGGNLTHTGAFTQEFVASANTVATLPAGTTTLLATTGSGSSLTFGTGSLSLAGNLTTSGAFATTLTTTATTSVTLPTSGTLVNTAVATLSSLTSVGTIGTGVWQGTAVGLLYGGTGATTAAAARSNLGATTKVTLVGTGSGTTIALTHGLGTNLVTAQVYDTSTSTATLVEVDITVTSTVATATFAATTTLSNYTLVVIG